MLTLDTIAHFTWGWSHRFFLETDNGNYIWSDPDYPFGNNTITPFKGTYKDWLNQEGISFARDKGKHIIRNYCGENVQIIE